MYVVYHLDGCPRHAFTCWPHTRPLLDCKIKSGNGLGMRMHTVYDWIFLFIRKDYGLHRTTAPSSLLPTRVHPNTVSVHLGSREGLQLASSPLIAWTVTASATVTEKVRSGRLMLQWSPITCTCTSVQSFIYVHN